MRRNLAVRIGILVLVVFTTTAPAFAAPRDDSPTGPIGRFIEKVAKQVRRGIAAASDQISLPKP